MRAIVEIIAGRGRGRSVQLEPGEEVVLGRGKGCELRLADHQVSRRHCRLRMSEEGLILEDLGSTNGTVLDGEQVDAAPVSDGGVIDVGSIRLQVRLTDEEAPPATGRRCSGCGADISAAELRQGRFEVRGAGVICEACAGSEEVDTGETQQLTRAGVLPPGARLGKCEIKSCLGRGGMATVYRAHHQTLAMDVAIKVVSYPVLAANKREELHQRFLREARSGARIRHPNVIRVLDVDEDSGLDYMVLELQDGPSLKQLMKQGPLAADEAARIGVEVARGLRRAHDLGIVHRDVKPANIFVNPGGEVKIGDFGLARWMEEGARLTRPDQVLGTPMYISPEQVRAMPVDTRADIYSLGAMLFHLIAGEPPYSGETPMATCLLHMQAPVPSLKDRQPACPPGLDAVVDRMMAKSPADRYSSCAEVVAALRPFAGESLEQLFDPDRVGTAPGLSSLAQAEAGSLPLDRLEGLVARGQVGTSTFGPLYKVYHELMQREMLLLFLDPEKATDIEAVRRFRGLGRQAARLRHPRLARIYEVSECEGAWFATLDFPAGGSLWDAVCRSGPVEPERAVDLMDALLEAVGVLHERQVVRGGFEPGHVLIEPTVRLSPYDLALAEDPTKLPSEKVGDYFTAPERLRGGRPTPAADLYSVAALVYFAAIGRPPRDNVPPSRLPTGVRVSIPDALPDALRRLLTRCLAPEADRRPKSSEEARAELDGRA